MAGEHSQRGAAVDPVIARTGWLPFACAIGALLLVAGAALVWNVSPYWGRNGDQVPASAGGNVTTRAAARTVRLSPHRIEIPTLHAEAPIVKVGTTPGGELNIPLNPRARSAGGAQGRSRAPDRAPPSSPGTSTTRV